MNKLRKINFDFSPMDIFCKPFTACCPKKRRYLALYKKAYHNINNHLNIYFYLKLIQDIEIIKHIAFNDEQINILNFVAKPLMSEEVNFKNPNPYEIDKLFDNEANINNGLNAYEKIIYKDKKLFTELDFKFLKLFKSELDSIINSKKQ